jgi:hypothetical protein
MSKWRGLRTGPLPDPHQPRHRAPVPLDRLPPFLLLRQADGDVLIAPFPRNGMSPEAEAVVKTVARGLTRDLPAGCWWVDPRDGRTTPAAIAEPQLKRRMLDCATFNVRVAAA